MNDDGCRLRFTRIPLNFKIKKIKTQTIKNNIHSKSEDGVFSEKNFALVLHSNRDQIRLLGEMTIKLYI